MSVSFRLTSSLSPVHSWDFSKMHFFNPRVVVPNPVPLLKSTKTAHSRVVLPENVKVAASELPVTSGKPTAMAESGGLQVDLVTEADLKANGFRSTRRTKIVCTIGPRTYEFEEIEALAVGGMNVARVNMCHGTRGWHRNVIRRVRQLNEEKGFAVVIMMDTEGSEIHMDDLNGSESAKAEDGEIWTFTVRAFDPSSCPERTITVNYDGFAEGTRNTYSSLSASPKIVGPPPSSGNSRTSSTSSTEAHQFLLPTLQSQQKKPSADNGQKSSSVSGRKVFPILTVSPSNL